MATVELTVEQILDAIRQLPESERRRIVAEIEHVSPSGASVSDQMERTVQKLRSRFRMNPADRKRMSELLRKATEGKLTGEESGELDRLVDDFEQRTLEMAEALVEATVPARAVADGDDQN